jgi:hypothetical protein
MNRFHSFRLASLTVVALCFASVTTARAESRPYSYQETGQFVSASDFVAEGQATHLGHFLATGTVLFVPTDDPAVLQFLAFDFYTAADGDELHAVTSGLLNLQTGAGAATVIFVGGTGRFADATGTVTAVAQLLPDGAFEVAGEGTIDY